MYYKGFYLQNSPTVQAQNTEVICYMTKPQSLLSNIDHDSQSSISFPAYSYFVSFFWIAFYELKCNFIYLEIFKTLLSSIECVLPVLVTHSNLKFQYTFSCHSHDIFKQEMDNHFNKVSIALPFYWKIYSPLQHYSTF